MRFYKSAMSALINLLNNLRFISIITISLSVVVIIMIVQQMEQNRQMKESIQENTMNYEKYNKEFIFYKETQKEKEVLNDIQELSKRYKKKINGTDIDETSQDRARGSCKKYFSENNSILNRFDKDGLKVSYICRGLVKK